MMVALLEQLAMAVPRLGPPTTDTNEVRSAEGAGVTGKRPGPMPVAKPPSAGPMIVAADNFPGHRIGTEESVVLTRPGPLRDLHGGRFLS